MNAASQISPAVVQQVLNENPDLSANGFRFKGSRFETEMSPEEFDRYRVQLVSQRSLEEIATTCEYLKHLGIQRGSYGLKHDVENWGRDHGMSGYVSNGSAIVGAILSGYKVVRERNSPNCTFR
jgi:hypothetical protein